MGTGPLGPRPHSSLSRGVPRGVRLVTAMLAGVILASGFLTTSLGADELAPDTLSIRFDAGARADWTNEQFYEDTFVDTTFLARRLVETPESRVAAVMSATLAGTRRGRRHAFQLVSDASLGDRLSRGALNGFWRHEADSWRWSVTPRAEYERDQTFGRDLESVRATSDVRVRRDVGDGTHRAFAGAGGELLRASGEGSQFLLDRNAARATLGLERVPVVGTEWRAAWLFAARMFPDSIVRDHVELGWEADVRRDLEGGHFFAGATHGSRRTARNAAPDTRDAFFEADVAAEAEWRLAASWAGNARVEMETQRYDEPDSVVFLDYRILRARLMPRYEQTRWTLAAGPHAEWLNTGIGSLEEYTELSAAIELEALLPGSWWSIAPELGWRDYREAAVDPRTGQPEIGAHSSYRFIELNVYGDQRLPGELRIRLLGSGRYEAHTKDVDDARSLYISLDVRKIF